MANNFNSNNYNVSKALTKSQADKLYVSSGTAITQNMLVVTDMTVDGNTTLGNDSNDTLTVPTNYKLGTTYNTGGYLNGSTFIGSNGQVNNANLFVNTQTITANSLINYTTDLTSQMTSDNNVVSKKYVDNAITSCLNNVAQMNYSTTYSGNTIIPPVFTGANHTFNLNFTTTSHPLLFYQCMMEIDFSFVVYYSYTAGVVPLAPYYVVRSSSVYLLTVNQKGTSYYKALSCNSCSNTFVSGQSAPDVTTACKPTVVTNVDSNHTYTPVSFSTSSSSPTVISVVFGTPTFGQLYTATYWIGQLSTSCRILSGTHGFNISSFTTTENSLDSPYFTFIN